MYAPSLRNTEEKVLREMRKFQLTFPLQDRKRPITSSMETPGRKQVRTGLDFCTTLTRNLRIRTYVCRYCELPVRAVHEESVINRTVNFRVVYSLISSHVLLKPSDKL